jgi:NTP pyrophosphatase (non-canonical NTP hydrolase)
MTFEEMKNGILKVAEAYSKRFNVKMDHDFAVLKLFEEVGEYAQAIIVHKKKSKPEKYISEEEAKKRLGEELADIIGMAIINADLFGIDIQKSINEKWLKNVSE